jgi:hypothetical protein
MTSPKQRAANKANALKSTGPKSDQGKVRSRINATKHALSLPVDETVFSIEIKSVASLIRSDCDSDFQAQELAKRIIDYERNEAFLISQRDVDPNAEVRAWAMDPHRFALYGLVQQHENKERVPVTFTTPNKNPKGKERTEEKKFIEDFLKLQDKVLLGKAKTEQAKLTNSQRYQKRAINQLVKGVRAVASGQDL